MEAERAVGEQAQKMKTSRIPCILDLCVAVLMTQLGQCLLVAVSTNGKAVSTVSVAAE